MGVRAADPCKAPDGVVRKEALGRRFESYVRGSSQGRHLSLAGHPTEGRPWERRKDAPRVVPGSDSEGPSVSRRYPSKRMGSREREKLKKQAERRRTFIKRH